MVLKDAGITILSSEKEVIIEIEDNNSSIKFVKVTMTPEQFTQALSKLSNTRCVVEVNGLDRVGKKMEVDRIKFIIDPKLQWKKDNDYELIQLAEENCPEGWEVRAYFRSRDSFVKEGNKTFLVVNIRRWVDMEE